MVRSLAPLTRLYDETCVVIVMFVLNWFDNGFETTWKYKMRILQFSNTSRVQMVFEDVFHFDTILV